MKKILLILVLIAVGGISWYKYADSGKDSYVFKSQPIVKGDITASVSATGNVKAVETVDVGTQISGTIKELYADFNSQVDKGQLIALLDTEMLEAQVASAKANLDSALAGVAKAKATLLDAQRTYDRNKGLISRSAIAQNDLDSSETQLQIAKAGLLGAEASVSQARASLKVSQTNFNYAKITSPVDGVVISRQVEVGQTVAASLQAPTLFTIARDLTQMKIETNVDEADIGKVSEGQKVTFTVDAWPQSRFTGDVQQVRLSPQTVQNVVTYTVVLNVPNAELKLRPGMTANVSIITEQRKDVLKVPSAALRFSPPENTQAASSSSPFMMPRPGGGRPQREVPSSFVWTVEDGKLKDKIMVRQGISEGGFVEVLSASPDIKEGMEVAVSWSNQTK